MQKTSNAKALTFIDALLTEIKAEKVAEESPITAKAKDTGGAPAGTVPAKVEGQTDTSPGKTKVEEKAKEGAFGKEKSGDLDASPGTNVEDSQAENNEKPAGQANKGNMGAEPIEGAKEETPSAVEAEKLKVAEEEKKMINEFKRAQTVGNLVLAKIAERAELAKQADEEPTPEQMEQLVKMAADEAYQDFVTSYEAGLLKRAEDEAAVQEALGVSPEEASGLLDEVAAENPEAVLPAEEEGEEDEGVDEDALLEALVEAGVSPEELAEAEAEVDAEGGEGDEEEAMDVEAMEKEAKRKVPKSIWRSIEGGAKKLKNIGLWKNYPTGKAGKKATTGKKVKEALKSLGVDVGAAGALAGAGYGGYKGVQALTGSGEEKESSEKIAGILQTGAGKAEKLLRRLKRIALWKEVSKAGAGKSGLEKWGPKIGRGAQAAAVDIGALTALGGLGYGAHKGIQSLYGDKKAAEQDFRKEALKDIVRAVQS